MPQVAKQIQTVMMPSNVTPSTTEAFERDVRDALAGAPDLLRLDCLSLERVVSSHINLLWNALTRCRDAGVTLHLAHSPAALMRILYVLDLVEAFEFEGVHPETGQRLDQDLQLVKLPHSFSDSVQIDIDDIDDAIARFVAFLGDIRVSATTMLELRTIYYEIATNIRIHSGMTEKDRFLVTATAGWDYLEITFTDSGRPFDPTAGVGRFDPAAASQHRQRRGFGLPMIHQLADNVEYRRDEGSRNVLTLTKKWHR
jgi:anti-sigma regulatory factor (Ser/Thr protein kinase)/anti-anti-sigma regulatory factor